jgi:ribosomal protein S18 acetylase RimI-like enzyme
MEIVTAASEAQLEQVRSLFEEYWASFGFTTCFQNFGEEVAELPGRYAPPDSRLAMALMDGETAGCVALRQFDAERCEVKRLYVRPRFRGCSLGRALMDWAIAEARRMGYREVVGDTMPVMTLALAMYRRMGFEQTGPYAEKPTPGAVFLRLKL